MFDTISEEELEKILHKNDFKRGQEGYIQVSEAIKEAQKNHTLKQVIDRLKKWQQQGTHLVSSEAIAALQRELI